MTVSCTLSNRVADVFAPDRFGQSLCHYWIAIRHIKIDQACPAPDNWFNHSGHGSAEPFLERSKISGYACRFLDLIGRRCSRTRRRFARIGSHASSQERAPTVVCQSFGTHNPGKKRPIDEVLLDRSQCFLAGEKHRAHARCRFFRGDESRLLKLDLENSVSLVKFGSASEIAERKKQSRNNTKHNNPDSFDDRMPQTKKIQAALLLERIDIHRERRRHWDRSWRWHRRNRIKGRVCHGTRIENSISRQGLREASGAPASKKALRYSDSITGSHLKTFTATTRETFRVHP